MTTKPVWTPVSRRREIPAGTLVRVAWKNRTYHGVMCGSGCVVMAGGVFDARPDVTHAAFNVTFPIVTKTVGPAHCRITLPPTMTPRTERAFQTAYKNERGTKARPGYGDRYPGDTNDEWAAYFMKIGDAKKAARYRRLAAKEQRA